MALALLLALATAGPAGAQTTTDYDTDDDGLIDVSSQAQLAAITHDLNGDGDTSVTAYGTAFPQRDTSSTGRMGCPSGACTGYELSGNVTLSGAFTPIGAYTATFDGNGNTISGLSVTASSGHAGLFSELGATGVIRNVGLTSPTITSSAGQSAGGLVGLTAAGSVISASYVSGGTITVSANNSNAGGLAGYARGIIRAGYSTATVAASSGNPSALDLGGLVGHLEAGTIIASYASGTVTPGSGTIVSDGLLVGRSTNDSSTPPNTSTITNSYCAAATGDCIGSQTGGTVAAERQTISAMQTPTDYSGIYLNWNVDLDADGGLDYPWNFGASSAYPTLNTLAQRGTAAPAAMDYDADDDGLIDIGSIALLHAMRWDPDGDGDPQTDNYSAYGTAFGGRTHTANAMTGRMGCPAADGCTGYELTGSLTFPTSGAYSNWEPVLDYASTFEGNGFTLTGLNIAAATGNGPSGLFEELTSTSGLIRNVGLINPTVSTANANHATGALVGWLSYRAVIETSYVSGGSVTSSGDGARVGGLVGLSQRLSVIRASYSTAAVSHSGNPDNIQVGGLLGYSAGGEIRASYAAGAVDGGSGSNAAAGGIVGRAAGTFSTYPDTYFDTQATGQSAYLGNFLFGSTTTPAVGHNTETLQRPVTYESVYANWNLDLDGVAGGDNPWNFGTAAQYPTLHPPGQRSQPIPAQSIFPPPPIPPPYNPAADHPESYANPRYAISAACEVRTTGEGDAAVSTATLTFDLGAYTRPVTLSLSLWDGQYFRTLESQGLPTPALRREGQTVTVEVATDPAQTRFRIDSEHGLNLILGYADCHTDDRDGAARPEGGAPGFPGYSGALHPEIYANPRYAMAVSCRAAGVGGGEGAALIFNLGRYTGPVTLTLSLWDGQNFRTLESQGLPTPALQREGRIATVELGAAPEQTRFRLDSEYGLNLLLGYADCRTDDP